MKKIISLIGITIISAVIFISTKDQEQYRSTDLDNLLTLNTANAECLPPDGFHGHCLVLLQMCVGDPFSEECDPTRN